jgi:hypothetical protein
MVGPFDNWGGFHKSWDHRVERRAPNLGENAISRGQGAKA